MSEADILARLEVIETNQTLHAGRLRRLEKEMETFVCTPWWKRVVFLLDGWPTTRLAVHPQWRPWRRWWRS
jgi:hypothetical protein